MMYWPFSRTHRLFASIFSLLLISGCHDSTSRYQNRLRRHNETAESVNRFQDDHLYALPKITPRAIAPYPWQRNQRFQNITKEYFRCQGKRQNPPILKEDHEGRMQRTADCNGQAHSLPVVDGEEFIYPILIDLLNFLQDETGHPVVITCGHRCPDHNTYADDRLSSRSSKHQIGAEVDFYIQEMEQEPEKIIAIILDYYKKHYPNTSSLRDFQRYEKGETDVAIPPWYNKEIFIKLYGPHEGRDFDNRHSFPYIGIQVRWDRDKKRGVAYSWPLAHRGYHRD